MRNRKTQGFTLIELLIVIAIIGILAAVLIPNLLNARARAFDTAAQSCLKEIATAEELRATTDPWQYSANSFSGTYSATGVKGAITIASCASVTVATANPAAVAPQVAGVNNYGYSARHANGSTPGLFYIANGRGVTTTAP